MGPQHWAVIDGGQLAYWRFGTPSTSRPPIVLIPGYGNTARSWSPLLLSRLAEGQEVILLDNRGMGQSKDFTSAALTVELMARDTSQLIQALELDHAPNVLGVSLGAFITLALAALEPDWVNKGVVVAGTPGGPAATVPDYDVISQLLDPALSAMQALNLLYPLQYPIAARAACEAFSSGTLTTVDQTNVTALQRQAQGVATYLLLDTTVYDRIPNITVPVLLVAGQDDVIIPAQNSRSLAARLLQPWLAIYPEAGHGVFAEYRDEVLDLVDLFLDQ